MSKCRTQHSKHYAVSCQWPEPRSTGKSYLVIKSEKRPPSNPISEHINGEYFRFWLLTGSGPNQIFLGKTQSKQLIHRTLFCLNFEPISERGSRQTHFFTQTSEINSILIDDLFNLFTLYTWGILIYRNLRKGNKKCHGRDCERVHLTWSAFQECRDSRTISFSLHAIFAKRKAKKHDSVFMAFL